jgi:pimeloyl-ACP methyl ester carboxylesterase
VATVAAAGSTAVKQVLDGLRAGSLVPDLPAVAPRPVVGMGQSMGSYVLVAMQAHHRAFDAVVLCGGAMVRPSLPVRPDAPEVAIPAGTSAEDAALLVMMATDWAWAFHWDEEQPPALVTADIAAGLPVRQSAPPWASLTVPGCVYSLVEPGVVAKEAAAIDVPVLVTVGERDLTLGLTEELGAFTGTGDLAGFVQPRSAHMHNFAGTRELLWRRIDAFLSQVGS